MTRQIRPLRPRATPPLPAAQSRPNQGWGKLVGATLLGVAGALTLKLPGAITGMVLGAALGHWFDVSSAETSDVPPAAPPSAGDLAREANEVLAAEVTEAFVALERASGRKADRAALLAFLRDHFGVRQIPKQGPEIPWQQDVASACGRLTQRLDPREKAALVVSLYRHARALDLGPGPARLLLRDGVAALGIDGAQEDELRATADML